MGISWVSLKLGEEMLTTTKPTIGHVLDIAICSNPLL